MKKIDMHVHTSGASFCSEVSGKMAVSAYRSAGLDGIVLTNHYSLRHFGYFADNVDAAVQNYIAEYDRVKRVFRQAGLSVILGAEVEMIGDGSISEERKNYEFLLYGADKTFFIENPELYKLSQRELYKLCHDRNIRMFQSHPYRSEQGHSPADPEFIDGVEINTHPKFAGNYDKVLVFADRYGLGLVCGSDMHSVSQAGSAYTLLPDTLTPAALSAYLSEELRPVIVYDSESIHMSA